MNRAVVLLLALAACSNPEPRAKRIRPDAAPPRPAPDAEPVVRDCDPALRTACVGDAVHACMRDGWFGVEIEQCEHGCKRGACTKPCEAQGVELIYVVDTSYRLLSFDPQKLPGDPFKLVGDLTCETYTTPFSMAVDQNGIAWVRYQSGSVYQVSILDAHCTPAAAFEGDEPGPFGMGFGTDGTDERLYVATRDELAQLELSPQALRYHPIGPLHPTPDDSLGPELTGTRDGKLYGYFSSPGLGYVQELDRKTGRRLGHKMKVEGSGSISAFAFAHWGGIFYVFSTNNGNSQVHAIHRNTGKSELVLENLFAPIVGAGVSTCAPELERP